MSSFASGLLCGVLICGCSCLAQEVQVFGNFARARAISLDPHGNAYITDVGTNSVLKFDSGGNPVGGIGGYGWGQLEFDQPHGVCATNGLDVFVADFGNHRVQRYNRKLEYIATLYTRERANELERFGYPRGIAINRLGDLLVCDTENRRVLKISGFNRVVRSIGGIDAGKGRLLDPVEVEVDERDNVYVLDKTRIVVYDNFGNYLRTFGEEKLRAASGFCIAQFSVFIAQQDTVFEYAADGRFMRSIATGDLLPAGSGSEGGSDRPECVDVAADQSRLILLFSRFAVVEPR